MLPNPWIDLPEAPPYVLPSDMREVDAYNLRLAGDPKRDDLELRTDLLPDPYGGDPAAPVVLLLTHTGYSDGDFEAQQDPAFRAAVLANLTHEPSDWPLFSLNPAFRTTPSGEWWTAFLSDLIRQTDVQSVAKRVLYLELSPYHAKEGGVPQPPSRAYVRDMLRAAIARNALVVGLLGQTLWTEFVPALRSYRSCYWPKMRLRQALLTENTIGTEAFTRMVGRVRD